MNGPYGPINQGYQNGPNRPRGNGQFGRPQHQGRPRGRLNHSNTNQSLLNQLLSSFTRTNNGGTTRIMNKVSHEIRSYNEHFSRVLVKWQLVTISSNSYSIKVTPQIYLDPSTPINPFKLVIRTRPRLPTNPERPNQ